MLSTTLDTCLCLMNCDDHPPPVKCSPTCHLQLRAISSLEPSVISPLNKVSHFINQSVWLMSFLITEVTLPCNANTGSKDTPDGLCLNSYRILGVLQGQVHSRCSNSSLRTIGELVHEVVGRVEGGRRGYGWTCATGRRQQGEGSWYTLGGRVCVHDERGHLARWAQLESQVALVPRGSESHSSPSRGRAGAQGWACP